MAEGRLRSSEPIEQGAGCCPAPPWSSRIQSL